MPSRKWGYEIRGTTDEVKSAKLKKYFLVHFAKNFTNLAVKREGVTGGTERRNNCQYETQTVKRKK